MATTGDPALDRLLQALHGLDDRGAQRLVAQAWARAERDVVDTLTGAIRAVLLRDAAAILERGGMPLDLGDGARGDRQSTPTADLEPQPAPEAQPDPLLEDDPVPEAQPDPAPAPAPEPVADEPVADEPVADEPRAPESSDEKPPPGAPAPVEVVADDDAVAAFDAVDEPDPEAWYVYGVIDGETGTGAELQGVPGMADRRPVQLVEHAGLAAVVSPAPLEEWAPDALRERLGDRGWMAERVLAHERVLRTCVDAGPVVPMRFATIVTDVAAVRAFLAAREAVLRDALEGVRDRQEWGAKAFVDWERLRAHLRGGDEPVQEASEGATYFARKRSERALRTQAQEQARDLARTCYDRLAALAERTALLELREPDEDDPQGEGMILNGAFLVPEPALEAYWRTADELSAAHADAGLRIEVTGPWPPYSFVDLDRSEAVG